ncbi:hypothetical protein L0337_44040, partial [candidate division KSB1 bacterium]|nr:hypothetical protein [candidate division KSB1 bacterium]
PLNQVDNIIPAIANAVNYPFQADQRSPKQQLLEYFQDKRQLLILDNFEHLIAGSLFVTEILQAAPDVKIIATSRQRLNQSGETVFNLGGMDFPDWKKPADALEYSAVKLFMQSAKRVQPAFELTAENMADVARICQLVQGMPLGILLAASWLEMLSLEEITAEISHGLDFLATEMTDIPERQRSIRAVFDYSWNLMTADEQQVFMTLSAFRGGFTREAAQDLAGATLRLLMNLSSKSMLQRDVISGRYDIHVLLRQYAEERLESSGHAATIRQAYAAYYADFMHERELDIKGRRQVEGLNEVEADFENIRAAWYWVVDQRDKTLLDKMLEGLKLFCEMRDRYEERQEFFVRTRQRLFPHIDDDNPPRLYSRMLVRYAAFLGHREDMRPAFEKCLQA